MNKVNLIGRICNDLEVKEAGENKYTRFTLAVNRNYTDDDGNRPADFISCVAWNKSAEIINQYFKKGNQIGVTGKIQTGSYDRQDGTKAYTTDIIVEGFDFLDKKEDRPAPEYTETPKQEEDPFKDFGDEVELTDEDLPF